MKRKNKKLRFPHMQIPQVQTIHFDNGERRVLRNITHVESGRWIHIICNDDRGYREVMVNPDRVLFVSIKEE